MKLVFDKYLFCPANFHLTDGQWSHERIYWGLNRVFLCTHSFDNIDLDIDINMTVSTLRVHEWLIYLHSHSNTFYKAASTHGSLLVLVAASCSATEILNSYISKTSPLSFRWCLVFWNRQQKIHKMAKKNPKNIK